MTLRRKILLALIFLPFILFLIVLIKPVSQVDQHNQVELLFLITGLPILLFNYLEWTDPQFLDELFGISRTSPAVNTIPVNIAAGFFPQKLVTWQLAALLLGVLIIGIALGVGVIFLALPKSSQTAVVQSTPQNLPSPAVSTVLSPTGANQTATPTITITPIASQPSQIAGVSTLTAESESPTPSPTPIVTPDATRCESPTAIQIATIRAGVKLLDSTNDIQSGYLVKSIALDELWIFAANVYGPNFDGGVTIEPAVWSFYLNDGIPFNIFAINDTAYQNSQFPPGNESNPPIDMEVDGTNTAYECAVNGN